MTAITTPCISRSTTTAWERALLTISHRLERTAVGHMRRRAARLDREGAIQTAIERQRDASAAGALRMYPR